MAGNRNEEMVYCSFCGKNQEEVKKIIAGNGVFICNECVALSQEIIREETAEEVLADLAETPKPKELLDILYEKEQRVKELKNHDYQIGIVPSTVSISRTSHFLI